VKFKREFSVDAFGVDYEEEGHLKTVRNVSGYGIPEGNIILADFFDENFLNANREKFDVVFSAGFVEHFQEPEEVIRKQTSLLAKNGLLITIIPNAKYLIEFLSDKKTISLHNQSIMNPETFRKLFNLEDLEVKYCKYFGGLFNFGVFGQKKSLAKAIFKTLFMIQRLTLDNLEKIYFLITSRDITCRYSSPSLLCIARKK
jgi:SAM-dependent methyltransferase